MRYESLVIGAVIALVGIYLVSTHGSIGGTNLPDLLGLPCGGGASGNNSSFCAGFPGYSIGTVVVLFGAGLAANGLRSPSRTTPASTGAMPPELLAALQAATPGTPGPGGIRPGVRYCAKCGMGNSHQATYCQRCGAMMPSDPAATPGPAPSSTGPPPSTPPPPP